MRTAIAVMTFGFLVEKYDLFLEVVARSLAGRPPSRLSQAGGDCVGLLLIVLGGAMILVATLRFHQVGCDIDAAKTRPARGNRLDIVLVGLLLALGTALFSYLAHTTVHQSI